MRARVGYLGKRGQSGASAAAAAAARDAGSQRTAPSSPLVSLLRSSCCLLCLSSTPYTADAPAWYKCGCKAGDARCICPSFAAPRQMSRDQTPQFILLTVRTADKAGGPAGLYYLQKFASRSRLRVAAAAQQLLSLVCLLTSAAQ